MMGFSSARRSLDRPRLDIVLTLVSGGFNQSLSSRPFKRMLRVPEVMASGKSAATSLLRNRYLGQSAETKCEQTTPIPLKDGSYRSNRGVPLRITIAHNHLNA